VILPFRPAVGTWLTVVLLTGATVGLAQAPTAPVSGHPEAGATLGAIVTADRNAGHGGGTADFAVSLDVPLPAAARLRGEFGRARWTFDGHSLVPADLPPEQISLTRLTAALIVAPAGWGGAYAGAGAGLYRYRSELSPVPRPRRPGLHALAGRAFALPGGRLVIRIEGQVQAVGGPNAAAPVGVVQPFDILSEGRSRVFSNVLLNIGGGVGVAWRF